MNLFNLIGKLTLDTSDYDKGIADAKKQNTDLEEQTGKTSLATAGKWAVIIGAIAKVGQQIKKLITDSTQYADNIKNMAQIYGYSTREIQEMQSVAEQSGKSVEKVLKGIQSSGKTAAEYLGLSQEEYKDMVDEAYRFGTILSEESINNVDALGDRIAYLKSEWTAAITALLAGEEGAEKALDTFFDNVEDLVQSYAPKILRFTIKLLTSVARGLVQVMPEIVGDVISSVIDTIFSINWLEVGVKIIRAITKGVFSGIGKVFGRIFGINTGGSEDYGIGDAESYTPIDIGANDYSVSESATQKIDVSLKFDGDTPVGKENAELVGGALAQRIDEILGRRLNG